MVARFQCKPSMTTSLLTEVLDECEQLLVNTFNFLKQKVKQFFENQQLEDNNEAQNISNAFEFDSPFDGSKTLNQQIDALKQYCNYIEPIEIPLGYRTDSVLDRITSTYKPKRVMETCQYVPIISSLTLVMSSPEVRDAVHAEQRLPVFTRWYFGFIFRWRSCSRTSSIFTIPKCIEITNILRRIGDGKPSGIENWRPQTRSILLHSSKFAI